MSIAFTNTSPKADSPKLSGIEVKRLGPHLAHAGKLP